MQRNERIREQFLEFVSQNSELFDKSDVMRVRRDEWSVERFTQLNASEEKALKALIEAMEWRKAFGVNHFNDHYFPEEFYKIGLFSTFGEDRDGRQLLWFTGKNYYPFSDLKALIREFTVYQFERLDRQNSHQGWAIVLDPNDMSLANVDIDYILFMARVCQKYFQRGIKYFLVLDIPWILDFARKVVLKFLSEDMKASAKFIKKKDLVDYIDCKWIPRHLNGTYEHIVNIPVGVKPIHLLINNHLNDKQIENFRTIFKLENNND